MSQEQWEVFLGIYDPLDVLFITHEEALRREAAGEFWYPKPKQKRIRSKDFTPVLVTISMPAHIRNELAEYAQEHHATVEQTAFAVLLDGLDALTPTQTGNIRVCSICGKSSLVKGLCGAHYQKQRRERLAQGKEQAG